MSEPNSGQRRRGRQRQVEPTLSSLAFRGSWRHYQQAALDAFEQDRRAGRRRTHIAAPPGSGKTLLGVEIVRRLGAPALVLVPNSAVQAQWLRMVARFTGGGASTDTAAGIARPDPDAPIACLTYQAFCQVDDPSVVLGDAAERRWAAERAATTRATVEEVMREALTWRGAAAQRRRRELARITAAIKREVARGEHAGLGLEALLSEPARRRIDALRRRGVGTLVLDECHHLASLWGYVVRAIERALGDVHLVGLTGTPPEELTPAELELYQGLLGPVDYTIPTPAVVREGHLAPYQELAWLTRPLDSETEWLAEHDRRFQELITALHSDDGAGPLSFPAWVITRARGRGPAEQDAALTWASFQRRHPALARACVRFLASAGLVPPDGAPRGEGYRQPPDLTDWLVLLEDYTLRCLRAHPSPEAAARDADIATALRDLGFILTRQGIRRGASDVDRLLGASAAKTLALAEVIGCEEEARGSRLRALVLTDTEVPGRGAAGSLVGVLRPDAGSAVDAVRALAADQRTSHLRPLLVSGRGLRCAPEDASELLRALATAAGEQVGGWRAEPAEPGLVRLVAGGAPWRPRLWVGLATSIFTAGVTRVMVGTRALLGEGWDAPSLNVLVDLTVATTAVSVRQMRGRSLRLDPSSPDKIASNWDVVCVAPELARGIGDYQRFVSKHLHLFAPTEDGVIEAGPSHVHPDLGPFAPPPAEEFSDINRQMGRRARELAAARDRWGIGQPYAGQELATLVARPIERRPPPAREAQAARAVAPAYPLSQRLPLSLAGLAATAAAGAAAAGSQWLGLGMLAATAAGLGAALIRLGRVERELGEALPLDLVAHAIVDTYVALGELREAAAGSLTIEPRASGYLRCFLRQATPEEATRFTTALQDVLEPDGNPRYLVSRLVPGAHRGPARRLGRVLLGRPPFQQRWHAVPGDLGRTKARATAFASSWTHWLGPSTLLFTQRSDEGRRALAEAGAQAATHDTRVRKVWV